MNMTMAKNDIIITYTYNVSSLLFSVIATFTSVKTIE